MRISFGPIGVELVRRRTSETGRPCGPSPLVAVAVMMNGTAAAAGVRRGMVLTRMAHGDATATATGDAVRAAELSAGEVQRRVVAASPEEPLYLTFATASATMGACQDAASVGDVVDSDGRQANRAEAALDHDGKRRRPDRRLSRGQEKSEL